MQDIATVFPEQGTVPARTEDMIALISRRTITFQDGFADDTPFVIIFPQINF